MEDEKHLDDFIREVRAELKRARSKFPAPREPYRCLAALTEEVGELNQAVLQYEEEPHKGVTLNDIRMEAVQVATMAARIILDC